MHKRRMAAFRLPFETIAQIEVLASGLQRRSYGKVSQADAIAWAVARAVEELTASEPAPAASPPAQEPPAPREKEEREPRAERRYVAGIGGPLAQMADRHAQLSDLDAERKRAVEGTIRMLTGKDRATP
jgi:hypothetical protein